MASLSLGLSFVFPRGRLVAAAAAVGFLAAPAVAQTVTYTMQTGNFNSLQIENNTNPPYAGILNSTATEMQLYANSGGASTPGAAAFQTFSTSGSGTGTARPLQVGDSFTATVYAGANPSSGGYVGISFRDSTSYTNVAAATDDSTEARFQLDNTGGWKIYNAGSAVDSGQGAASDRTFTITVTSSTTFNATVGGSTYYNLGMAAEGGTIDSFAVYNYGQTTPDVYWKSASLTSTGEVQLGYALASGTSFTPGLISDGLEANSNSTVKSNAVFVGGDAGSQVNLTQANTYTGTTTVNSNAAAEAQDAGALGFTDAGTVVLSGGALKLYSPTGISYAAEPLTLNGVGVSGANGALLSVGGTNTWTGGVTLASNSRINADTSGGAGSLAISGNVAGGENVLFVGADGAAISISGTISGAGGAEAGTTTSIFKDGAGTLTLSGSNTYTGDTRITSGTLTVASGGNLGDGSDVFLSDGAVLNVNTSVSVASVREASSNNSGTIAIAGGATLTVAGSGFGVYQNSISGSGNLAITGSGTTSLFGTQSYSGTTSVSAGKLATSVTLATSAVNVSGGEFAPGVADALGDSVVVSLSGAGLYTVGGNDTIGGLTGNGGTVALGANKLTVATGADQGFDGVITGSGSFIKDGAATLTLNGDSSAFSGSTLVKAGTLSLVGALGGTIDVATGAVLSGNLSIATGKTLGGNGTVSGNVFLDSGSLFDFVPGNTLTVTGGTVSFGGFGIASIAGLSSSTPEGTYTLISGSVDFTNVSNVGAGAAVSLEGGKSAYLQQGSLQLVVVPEPSAVTVLAAGCVAAAAAHRLRRRTAGRRRT